MKLVRLSERVITYQEGSYGKVYHARSKNTGNAYALKIMDKGLIESEKAEEQTLTEISIMERLKHPNILTLLTYFEDQKYIYLVLES